MANETQIISILKAAATLSAVCSTRIYADEADQALRVTGGSDPRSYVVINLVTGTPLNYVGQSYAMTSRRIQINLYATTPLVARAMMDACIAALESYGVILFENPSFYDGATKLYSRSLDFSIHQPR